MRAQVEYAEMMNACVKRLVLRTFEPMMFRAGQWVDFIVPELGLSGYSICNEEPQDDQIFSGSHIELAIQKTSCKISQWVHSEDCKVGSEVEVKLGGDCVLDFDLIRDQGVVFIAGGMGINPLFSMLRTMFGKKVLPRRVCFLHSAKTMDDLLFSESIAEIQKAWHDKDCFTYERFVSRSLGESPTHHSGRITKTDLENAFQFVSKGAKHITLYLCGPSPMINEIIQWAEEFKTRYEIRVQFEKWW
jgi:ferredoxin-NADP reductase